MHPSPDSAKITLPMIITIITNCFIFSLMTFYCDYLLPLFLIYLLNVYISLKNAAIPHLRYIAAFYHSQVEDNFLYLMIKNYLSSSFKSEPTAYSGGNSGICYNFSYSSSDTGSSHWFLVSSPGTSIAIWLNQQSFLAPCQCFTLAGILTISPGAKLLAAFPCSWYQPSPSTHMSICPPPPADLCICQLLRHPGSNI